MAVTKPGRLNIDEPRWDQSRFVGRLKHFFAITDPRFLFYSSETLNEAKQLVDNHRLGLSPPGTTDEQLLYAKRLYDSSFHPDTGERLNIIGSMSCQVPGGMIITGGMLQFYQKTSLIVLWQWINQSFNALVNYTNRNATSEITNTQIGVAYVSATTSALVTALGLNSLVKKAPPLMARYVPFAAVAAANCVNIPLMRQQELIRGLVVMDEHGNTLGESKRAATKAITQVCISRITIAAPGMLVTPIIMQRLEKLPFMKRIKVLHLWIQTGIVGSFLLFMVPVGCALFPQKSQMAVSHLETELRDSIHEKYGDTLSTVYFNKGL